MATSGLQEEKKLYERGGAGNYTYYGNVFINSVTRSGTSVTISGSIRFIAKGTSGYKSYYQNGVSAKPANNNSWQTILPGGEYINNGSYKSVNFSTTYTGIPLAQTSLSLTINYSAWYNSAHTSTYWTSNPSWTITFEQATTNPPFGTYSDLYASETTWNTIVGQVGTNWQGNTPGEFRFVVCTGSTNGDAANITGSNWESLGRRDVRVPNQTSSKIVVSATTANTVAIDSPLEIKGLLCFRLSAWARNSGGTNSHLSDGGILRHLPPSPSILSYTELQGAGAKTYSFSFTGDPANNHSVYDAAYLTRTIRYKVDNNDWVYIDTDTVAALDFTTTFSVTLQPGSTVIVEGWQRYHGHNSEVSTVTVANSSTAVALYGSVNNKSVLIKPFYASVNGDTKKIEKVYASVNGVTKKVYEDV